MKPTQKTLILSLLVGASIFGSPHATYADNPFETGTAVVHLSAEKIQSLSLHINQSKEILQEALDYGKNRTIDNEIKIYLDAIKKVVIESNAAHPTTEFLMRITLNQTMALTYGTPTADGTGVVSPGVLARTSYSDLMAAILRQSIETALAYVDQDLKAVEQDALFNLPYAEVALLRLTQSENWNRSVMAVQTSADFAEASLQHWLNTMAIAEHSASAEVRDRDARSERNAQRACGV